MITYGKRDLARILTLLEGEYDSPEDLARAVMDEAIRVVKGRAKYVVAAQLYYAPGQGWISPDELAATRGCVGIYSTTGDAVAAAQSMASNGGAEQWRTWVLPLHFGTPAEFHQARKRAQREAILVAQAESRVNPEEWAQARVREAQEWFNSLGQREKNVLSERLEKLEKREGS